MIYLHLFLSFLKIGAVSFGGGYGMISLVRETVVSNGWLTDTQMMNFIAVSESTPGPIAVNMATFVGFSQGGVPGAILATFGVILPAFLIMLLIASVMRTFMKRKGVNSFLEGVRPGVVALIMSTAVTMGLSTLFGVGGEKLEVNILGGMGSQQDGPALVPELGKEGAHILHALLVQAVHGLVQDDQGRIFHDSLGDAQALAHT